jgi:tellurite resistance protein
MDALLFVAVVIFVILILKAIATSKPAASPTRPAVTRTASTSVSEPRPAVNRRPKQTPEECWIPRGQPISIAGYELADGMVYVGEGLRSIGEVWALEPALIQPSLPVDSKRPDRSDSMGHWPSYAELSPGARAAYLEWLADGRRDPEIAIGFVFLFYYGIERRVLADLQGRPDAKAEADQLIAEVDRLYGIYGGQSSFRNYAGAFLDVARLLHRTIDVTEIEPPKHAYGFQAPLSTRLALGTYAQDGEPIPSQWVLSWVRSSSTFRLRTPATRCRDEFDELFPVRYLEKFKGEGLKIKPNKTRVQENHRPASPSFRYGTVDLKLPGLPDVTILTGPVNRIQALVDEVTDELDAYSRWIGRTDDRSNPVAVALLPAELAATRTTEEGQALLALIHSELDESGTGMLTASRVVAAWPSKNEGKLTKQESTLLAQFLEKRGLGIEPDPRFGGPVLSRANRALLFRQDSEAADHPSEASLSYLAAALLLHLSAAVATADGEVDTNEVRQLITRIDEEPELSSGEKRRLRHHLRWLLAERPGLAGMKRRIGALDTADRHALGRFLISVAGADGRIDPAEIQTLRKIYPLLGLEGDAVFSDVHSLIAGEQPASEGPVTVLPGQATPGYAIPPPRDRATIETEGLALDLDKIRATRQETQRVSALLADIFEEEEASPPAPPPSIADDADALCGLDGPHSAFLRALARQPAWERSEVERLAADLGVLPDGALELINEAAFEICGGPLTEGEDELELDETVLKEMLP